MNIVMEWIEDFVNLPTGLSDSEIAERLTLGVCEVEGWGRPMEVLGCVRVAEVLAVKDHPNVQRLRLATVDVGAGGQVEVFCGAPNCRVGVRVPYAGVGTLLPNGVMLEAREISGVVSRGMLCSAAELGVGGGDGLLLLPAASPVGVRLSELSDFGDGSLVLEVDNKSLTHRPDLWGHYGMAREFATMFRCPLKGRFGLEWKDALKQQADGGGSGVGDSMGMPGTVGSSLVEPVSLEVDADSCNRGFLCLTMTGVRVGESPGWMQRRLRLAGMRPVNSVVDVSNYVMLEMGMPNHIFDRESMVSGRIVVRRAGKVQDFITLDGCVRRLLPGDTLVCDGERPSSIAGIMGGMESAVSAETRSLVLEVANWRDADVRRTSARLGLRTDASQRYEKSLDSEGLEATILRLYELLVELNPGAVAVGGIQSANMPEAGELVVETGLGRISSILGLRVEGARVEEILLSLGFGVEFVGGDDGVLRVRVPSWRATKDVEQEVDVVEEVGRIMGYGGIRPESPHLGIGIARLPLERRFLRRAQDYLVLRGRCLEVMNSPLLGRGLLEKADWPQLNEGLVLGNALSPEQDRMRPGLVPGLLETVALNVRKHDVFRFFELGRVYVPGGGDVFSVERSRIGVVFHGGGGKGGPFMALADVMEGLLAWLGLRGAELCVGDAERGNGVLPGGWKGCHPHEFLDLRFGGESRGFVISLHPGMARRFRFGGHTAVGVLDVDGVDGADFESTVKFERLHRFPGNTFDLTVVVPERVYAEGVVDVVRGLGMVELCSVGVLDLYNLDDGKALTLRVVLRDMDRTLDSEFISGAQRRIVEGLEKAGYPLRV